jgi:outer membrane protein OmpA-like peptidoglycan-associated protein
MRRFEAERQAQLAEEKRRALEEQKEKEEAAKLLIERSREEAVNARLEAERINMEEKARLSAIELEKSQQDDISARRKKLEEELEKRKAEIAERARQLEERKEAANAKITSLAKRSQENRMQESISARKETAKYSENIKSAAGSVSPKTSKGGEISDEELDQKITESEERRMNPVLMKFNFPVEIFNENSYSLTPDGIKEIKLCAGEILKSNYSKVVVEGHTDSSESAADAKKSSRLRAYAVYNELLKNGIDPSRIEYSGLSYKIRADANKTKKGRMANRRTEVFVE